MLREDVVQAVAERRFRVYAVETVDQVIEILSGTSAGARGPDAGFPEGSFNHKVDARLAALAEKARAFSKPPGGDGKP